jgi:hypothetical protein
MFHSTLPAGASELMRVSDFRRYLRQLHADRAESSGTRLSSLTPSLLQDLMRFEREGQNHDLLEVVAAALRHGRNLLVHLGLGEHVIPLTVFAAARLAHSPLPADRLLATRLQALQVLQVEPAVLPAPGDRARTRLRDQPLYCPLGPLTWAMALRGARETLLPELCGPVAYRLTPGADLGLLGLTGTGAAAVERLRRDGCTLREMAAWPAFDRERAARMLNGLYLQSTLIISRAHPAATNEFWRN